MVKITDRKPYECVCPPEPELPDFIDQNMFPDVTAEDAGKVLMVNENGEWCCGKAGGGGSAELPAGFPYTDRHEKTVIPYFPMYEGIARWSAPVGTNEDLSLLVGKKLAVFDGVEWTECDGATVTESEDGSITYKVSNADTYPGEYDGVRTKFWITQISDGGWYLSFEGEGQHPLAVYVISETPVYHPIVANYLPDGVHGRMDWLDLVAVPDKNNENNVVSSAENFFFRPITWYYCEDTLPVGQDGDKYKAIVMGTEYELVSNVSILGDYVELRDADNDIRVVSLISGETSVLYKDQRHYFTKPGTYVLWDKEVRIYHAEERLPVLTSPNGTAYNLSVADDGTLSAVAVE